jgi:hypothetical protein
VLFYVFFVFYIFLCCFMYRLFCDILCIVCVYMCTELLPPGGYPIAVKYIISYHIISYIISYHIRKSKVHLLVFLIHLIPLINACNMEHIKLSYTSFTPLKYHFSLYFQAYWYICLILAEILKSHWLDIGLLQTNSHFDFTIIVISGSFKVLQQCAQGFCWKIRTL